MVFKQTPYAKKYGDYYTHQDWERSGFTPVAPRFPEMWPLGTPQHFEDAQIDEQNVSYQRDKFNGYTTQELIYLDAISNRPLKSANLQNGVHQVLNRWEENVPEWFVRKDIYPIENGFSGDWIKKNHVVAPHVEPILRLATRILVNMYMAPWVSADPCI